MAAIKYFNRVRFLTSTTGTGTLAIGAAFSNAFLGPGEAGAVDGDQVVYCIEEGLDFEIGRGVIGDSVSTLTRATVLASKIAGTPGTTKMNLAGAAQVRIIASAKEMNDLSTGVLIVTFDNTGAVLAANAKVDYRATFPFKLLSWTLLADRSGSINIGVWKDTLANYPPTGADSMTNAHNPAIAAATNAEDTDLSDWTTTEVALGDCLRFNIDSVTTIQRATLIFLIRRT